MHFVRHGEGYHNVAQREWRQASKPGEPYTIDTDPEFKFIDALLTPAGVEQVRLTYYLQISFRWAVLTHHPPTHRPTDSPTHRPTRERLP